MFSNLLNAKFAIRQNAGQSTRRDVNKRNSPRARILNLEALESRELLDASPIASLTAASVIDGAALVGESARDDDVVLLNESILDSFAQPLETPSTVVTTSLDVVDETDNLISLREAILYAAAGDTISFDVALQNATIYMDAELGELTVDKSITIDASNLYDAATSTPGLTLCGSLNLDDGYDDDSVETRILSLARSVELTVNGLAFTHGGGWNRGSCGVYSEGDLTLNNCSVTQCASGPGYHGGGVHVQSGTATFTNCAIEDMADGGGVYVGYSAQANFTNCRISDNYSDGDGGGVYVDILAQASFTNCSITGNGTDDFAGGGVYVGYLAQTIFTDCSIADNYAGDFGGGGVYVRGGRATMTNCSIVGNETTDGGGGLCVDFAGEATLDNCEISDNTVGQYDQWQVGDFSGGGVRVQSGRATLTNCTIENNVATKGGGGVYVARLGEATLTNCSITENVVNKNDGNSSQSSQSRQIPVGGGVYVEGRVTLNNCEIEGNIAEEGGGAFVEAGEATLTECSVSSNEATSRLGGGLSVYEGRVNLNDCSITSNAGTGVDIQQGEATLIDCAITGNKVESTFSVRGGGVYVGDISQATLTNCSIVGNEAAEGGGIYLDGYAVGMLTNCAIIDNVANCGDEESSAGYGGGVYLFYSSVGILTNCTVTGNSAVGVEGEGQGGGAYVYYQGALFSHNSIIYGNSATTEGADIYAYNEDDWATARAIGRNTLSSFTDWTDGANNLVYDASKPLFNNAANGDYTLVANSQAINKGDNANVTTTVDLAGNPRISGGKVDLGAYEYQGPSEPVALDAPTVTAAVNDTSITVSWNAIPNATKYFLKYKNAADSAFTTASVAKTASSYTLSGLTEGATYQFKVQAVGDKTNYLNSEYSDLVSATVPTNSNQLPTPTVTAAANGTSITVSWNAVPNATKYFIKYKNAADSAFTTVSAAKTASSYTLSGLTEGATYQFKVQAVGDKTNYQNSEYSDLVSATVPTNPNKLQTPTITHTARVTTDNVTSLVVFWNAVPNATKYFFKYKNAADSAFTTVSVANTASSYALRGLTEGAIYQFQVQAVGDKTNYLNSEYSRLVSVVVPTNSTTHAVLELGEELFDELEEDYDLLAESFILA